MTRQVFTFLVALAFASGGFSQAPPSPLNYKTKALDGKTLDLAQFQGKVILVVNVASECGYTGQYKGLQQLHDKFAKNGLVVLGVPSNEFGAQEPSSDQEIGKFCKSNYGVTFPMLAKQTIKGAKGAPLYQALASKELNPKFGGEVQWNFTKFLLGRDGKVAGRFEPGVEPDDAELNQAIAQALKAK
ncbi:MAG: glutathione peroxidase [Gemmataceae bacterium]|nr:glutathione peroxidase [Gemmataceae bacterium]